jgi:hypothetical protein
MPNVFVISEWKDGPEWKTFNRQDLDDYRNLDHVVKHDADIWKLYNTYAERDARLQIESKDSDFILTI